MTATKLEIIMWLEKARAQGATHLIIACDRYNYDNYPIYVTAKEDVRKEIRRIIRQNMQSIDEVYDMSMSLEEQLNEHRAVHF